MSFQASRLAEQGSLWSKQRNETPGLVLVHLKILRAPFATLHGAHGAVQKTEPDSVSRLPKKLEYRTAN